MTAEEKLAAVRAWVVNWLEQIDPSLHRDPREVAFDHGRRSFAEQILDRWWPTETGRRGPWEDRP